MKIQFQSIFLSQIFPLPTSGGCTYFTFLAFPLLDPRTTARGFHKHTKMAIMALLPTLYSQKFAVFSFSYTL